MIDQSPHHAGPDQVSAEQRPPRTPARGGRRRLALFALLALMLGLYPLVSTRIRAWRQRLAEVESATTAEASSGSPAPPRTATRDEREVRPPAPPSATADPPPPSFGELPEAGEARLRFLRQEAFQTARQLVADLPRQPSAMALQALTHNRFGQTDAAEKCWQACLQWNPQFADAQAGLGTIAKERGDNEVAVRHFREALRINPQLPELRPALADALVAQTQLREAAALLEEDVRRFPAATGSWYRLGQAYLQLGEYDQAARGYEAALRVDPQCTYAYYGLANAHRRLGQQEEFARHMRTFKQLKEQDLQVQRDATRRFDDEGEVRRTNAFVHTGAGRVYAEHGSPAKAESHWQRAIQVYPQEVLARTYLARLYDHRNQLPKVIRLLQELRTLEPQNSLHCLSLGVAQRRGNAKQAAEQSFREAIELAPKNPIGYVALADFYLRAGDHPAEARKLAERAVELEPTAPNYAVLGAACQQSGALADALRAIERALESDPRNLHFQQVRAQLQTLLAKESGAKK